MKLVETLDELKSLEGKTIYYNKCGLLIESEKHYYFIGNDGSEKLMLNKYKDYYLDLDNYIKGVSIWNEIYF